MAGFPMIVSGADLDRLATESNNKFLELEARIKELEDSKACKAAPKAATKKVA